jgi:hypothetical protein
MHVARTRYVPRPSRHARPPLVLFRSARVDEQRVAPAGRIVHLARRTPKRRPRSRREARATFERHLARHRPPFGHPLCPPAVEHSDAVVTVVAQRPCEATREDLLVVVVGHHVRVVAHVEAAHRRGERLQRRDLHRNRIAFVDDVASPVHEAAAGDMRGFVLRTLGTVAGQLPRRPYLAADIDDAHFGRCETGGEPRRRDQKVSRLAHRVHGACFSIMAARRGTALSTFFFAVPRSLS